jgi:GrpB-like predicted nucleotidyltransferase (UPF0157 family)
MSLAFPDVQGTRLEADAAAIVAVLAPRHYQDQATAAYEDAELLLSSILPDARIEAGYVPRPQDDGADRLAVMAAPYGEVQVTLQLVESGSSHESLMRFRDALRSDATLLASYNAIKIEAAPLGGAVYGEAKGRFIASVLGA